MSQATAGDRRAALPAGLGQQETGRARGRELGWPLGALIAVVALGGVSLWLTPTPIAAPWDVFILLDGGYRMSEGQVPGTDFTNPVGPLTYGLISLGMGMQDVPSLAAVGYGNLIFLVIAAALAWAVTRNRIPKMYAAGFTVFAGVLVVAVRPLGYSPWTTTYAMIYNRYGWVLYATLLLLVLLPPRHALTPRARVVQGALLGVLLGLLFYVKINFFLAAVLAVVAGIALGTLRGRGRLALGAVAGFAAVTLAMLVAFGVQPLSYLADVAFSAGAQSSSQRFGMLAHSVFANLVVGVLTLAVVVALLVRARRRGEPMGPLVRLALAVAFVGASSVLIAAGNTPEGADLPALVVAPLLLVVHLAPSLPRWMGGPPTATRLAAPLLVGVLALLVVTTGPIVGKDALGLGKAAMQRDQVEQVPASQRFASERLRDFSVPADAGWQTAYRTANAVPGMINDGLALLRAHLEPGDEVFTLALTDPFSFALGLPSTRGAPLWWDLGLSFDRSNYPDPGRAFGDARWVMVPRLVDGQGCCQETVEVMREVYAGYLDANFREVERTQDWILLARRP